MSGSLSWLATPFGTSFYNTHAPTGTTQLPDLANEGLTAATNDLRSQALWVLPSGCLHTD